MELLSTTALLTRSDGRLDGMSRLGMKMDTSFVGSTFKPSRNPNFSFVYFRTGASRQLSRGEINRNVPASRHSDHSLDERRTPFKDQWKQHHKDSYKRCRSNRSRKISSP